MLIKFRVINSNTRVILVDLNNEYSSLLSELFKEGIYDYIVDIEDIDRCLINGSTYSDALKFRHEIISDTTKEKKTLVNIPNVNINISKKNTEKKIIEKEIVKEVYRNISTTKIGVVGIDSRVGITHTALLLANALKENGKVAIIDISYSNHFSVIAEIVDGGHNKFKINDVDYFYNISLEEFLNENNGQYDFVVIDFGSFEDLNLDIFNHMDIKLLIYQYVDYRRLEVKKFLEYVKQYDKNALIKHIVPLINNEIVNEISSITNNEVYNLEYNINPFKPTNSNKKVLKHIIGLKENDNKKGIIRKQFLKRR